MTRTGMIQVCYFAALEIRGEASISGIMDCYRRLMGNGIRRSEVCDWLARKMENRNRELLGTQLGTSAGTSRELVVEHKTQFPGTGRELLSEPSGNSSCVPHKVLESEALVPSSESNDSSLGTASAKPPRSVRMDLRTLPEAVADDVLAELKPELVPTLRGITWTSWRMRNRRALVDMASADMTADEILAAYHAESEAIGEPIRSIRLLQERLNAHDTSPYARRTPRESEARMREDDLPLAIDLIDAGVEFGWEKDFEYVEGVGWKPLRSPMAAAW